MYPQLDYAQAVHPHKILDVDETFASDALELSKGKPEMSPQDVKIAIISLLCTCKSQQLIIDELVECVNELRTPKRKFRKHRK